MAPQSTGEITGLVLAGGRGQRMGGVDKGWVDYRGRPLIEIVVERFAPQVGPLVISANRNLERYRAVTAVTAVVADVDGSFEGPMAGVLAALAITRTSWLAVVPCDAPLLPVDLVHRLAGSLDPQRRAACARSARGLEPLFAILSCELHAELRTFFAAGGRSMRGWLESCRAVPVDFDDAVFQNVNALNTPDGAAR